MAGKNEKSIIPPELDVRGHARSMESTWICSSTIALGILAGKTIVKAVGADFQKGDCIDVSVTFSIFREKRGGRMRVCALPCPHRIIRLKKGVYIASPQPPPPAESSNGASFKGHTLADESEFIVA